MDVMETKPIFQTMPSPDSFTKFPNDDTLIQKLPILMNIKKEIPDTEHENDNLINQAYNLVNIKTDPDSIESGQYNNIEIFSEPSLTKIYDAKDLVKLDIDHLSRAIIKHESVDIKVETHGLDSTPMTTDLETSLISIKDESFGELEDFEKAFRDENLVESQNTCYVCKICNKTFVCQENLKRHEQTVHLKIQHAKCSHCNKSFTQMSSLKNHVKTVHLKIRDWKCNFCDKYFAEKGHLKRHEKTVHLKIRDWKCTHCDKSFTQKNHLTIHEKTVHLKIRDCKCNLCDKSFTQMAHLKNHEKTVHLKIRDWKCNLCDKHFTQKGSLKRHKEAVHLKNWQCNICEKTFANKVNLDSHSRVHSIDFS